MDLRTYYRAAAQSLFIILLVLIMAAPQLTSVKPAAGFAEARTLLETTPLARWIIIGAVALMLLIIISFSRMMRRPSVAPPSSTAQRLPIQDAVLPQNKGNGLASDTFSLSLPWLGIAGWVQIEKGKECVVIDGRRVVRQTQICFTPMRLIGKPIFARRVLLQPPPLTDLSAKALTADRLDLSLVTTVTYSVTNPVYVATQQAPLTQLTELISGIIAEYIRSDSLENIVGDSEGAIRRKLKAQLENSTSIRGYYSVTEVLKALPTGDERILEMIRKIREETSRKGLVEIQGATALVQAEYDRRIEQEKRELKDEYDSRQHERDLQTQQLQLQAKTLQEVMAMVAQIAGMGVNPKGALEEIRKMLLSTSAAPVIGIPRLSETPNSLLAEEQLMLERHKAALGITAIQISPHPDKQNSPGHAQITFPDFVLTVECSTDYPQRAPSAQIQRNNGGMVDLVLPWEASNRLLQVATTAKMRVQAEMDHSEPGDNS